MVAPVAVFAYNRADLLSEALESLDKNDLAKQTEMFIFSDGFKGKDDYEGVMKVREVIHSFEGKNNFGKVHVQLSDQNKGLKTSIVSGVSEVINKYKKIIVVEDDLIVAHNFLQFMNDALEFYEKDATVWAIGGCSFGLDKPLKKYRHDVYASYRVCSWGWASWENRWNRIDFEMNWYEEYLSDKLLQTRVACSGEDMYEMLKAQYEGKLDTWDVQWNFQQCRDNQYTILPKKSLVKNIGFQSGAHFSEGISDKYKIILNDNFTYQLEHVAIDDKLMREFQENFKPATGYKLLKKRLKGFYISAIKKYWEKRK